MAGIDKTYCDSWEDYKAFKEWANKQVISYSNGVIEHLGDYVWEYTKDDFKGTEIPIMNTPTRIDRYLFKNCPIQFVIDRMKEVYDENYFSKELYIRENIGTHCNITSIPKITKFPLCNKPLNCNYWWIQCKNTSWSYDEDLDLWVHFEEYLPYNTNVARIKSIKGIIRRVNKKWNLPKGLQFRISGKYIGETYLLTIK